MTVSDMPTVGSLLRPLGRRRSFYLPSKGPDMSGGPPLPFMVYYLWEYTLKDSESLGGKPLH